MKNDEDIKLIISEDRRGSSSSRATTSRGYQSIRDYYKKKERERKLYDDPHQWRESPLAQSGDVAKSEIEKDKEIERKKKESEFVEELHREIKTKFDKVLKLDLPVWVAKSEVLKQLKKNPKYGDQSLDFLNYHLEKATRGMVLSPGNVGSPLTAAWGAGAMKSKSARFKGETYETPGEKLVNIADAALWIQTAIFLGPLAGKALLESLKMGLRTLKVAPSALKKTSQAIITPKIFKKYAEAEVFKYQRARASEITDIVTKAISSGKLKQDSAGSYLLEFGTPSIFSKFLGKEGTLEYSKALFGEKAVMQASKNGFTKIESFSVTITKSTHSIAQREGVVLDSGGWAMGKMDLSLGVAPRFFNSSGEIIKSKALMDRIKSALQEPLAHELRHSHQEFLQKSAHVFVLNPLAKITRNTELGVKIISQKPEAYGYFPIGSNVLRYGSPLKQITGNMLKTMKPEKIAKIQSQNYRYFSDPAEISAYASGIRSEHLSKLEALMSQMKKSPGDSKILRRLRKAKSLTPEQIIRRRMRGYERSLGADNYEKLINLLKKFTEQNLM